MKLLELRRSIKREFMLKNIPSEDADFIIAQVLGVSHTALTLIDEVSSEQEAEINRIVEIRKTGKPIDKIFNLKHFYGLEFKVNEFVLSPRADSEILVDTALKIIKENSLKTALDICTGSGCLAVAIKKNADVEISASDISLNALKVAKFNAKKNKTKVKFIHSNMFEKIEGKFDLIISNPPYIASAKIDDLDVEVKNYDPRISLDGGADGLKFYKIIHNNIHKFLNPNGYLILEIGNDQKEQVSTLFNDFTLIESLKDYGGNDRALVFKLNNK